mmetsp:Transcript_7317/g.22479  ORF Transcript_7317/g.22479 Transcript_7317/m.22479 type:complete len:170 (+) Transcript_7317:2432-2941(+)
MYICTHTHTHTHTLEHHTRRSSLALSETNTNKQTPSTCTPTWFSSAADSAVSPAAVSVVVCRLSFCRFVVCRLSFRIWHLAFQSLCRSRCPQLRPEEEIKAQAKCFHKTPLKTLKDAEEPEKSRTNTPVPSLALTHSPVRVYILAKGRLLSRSEARVPTTNLRRHVPSP